MRGKPRMIEDYPDGQAIARAYGREAGSREAAQGRVRDHADNDGAWWDGYREGVRDTGADA